ncbi:MAG TPA: hypothetical protein VK511_07470, partial [Gemmatimonadaceae bacterium]|nr:hypothetical protein [Gemmatimonadaceae bacterium]
MVQPARALAVAIAAAAIAGCGSDSNGPTPAARTLSISASPRQIPPPTGADFVAAFDLAYGAGARGQLIAATWKELEPTSGALDVSSLINQLDYVPGRMPTIYVGIQLINTVAKEVPADLADTAFDAPVMRTRFHALIDALATALPGTVTYLSIGNEVDGYLQATNQWTQYRMFYEDALDYAHTRMPGVRVGVTAGYDGLVGASRAQMATLNTRSDVIMLTYYPIGVGFAVGAPTIARTAFPAMLTAANGKPVVIQELGYPASPLLGSSDAMQAEFFADAIDQWSKIDGARMPYVNLFLLHDFTEEECHAFGDYYGIPDNAEFEAYLCTLGLRHADGTPRPAWQAVVTA